MVNGTRRLVRYWKPVFARPRGRALIFLYAGRTPKGSAVFHHHHHGDDLPHLHLSEVPETEANGHDRDHSHPEIAHSNHHRAAHHGDREHEPGHWHFAVPAIGSASLPLLVL